MDNNQPTHGDIYLMLGRLEGRFDRLEDGIAANGRRASAAEKGIADLAQKVTDGELRWAELKGVGIGVKIGAALAIGAAGGGVFKAIEWLVGRF